MCNKGQTIIKCSMWHFSSCSHYKQAMYNAKVSYNEWLEYDWQTFDYLIT
jgi:hypothetical protein